MSPKSRRLMISFFAFSLTVWDRRRHGSPQACGPGWASRKSTSLWCGMRINFPFRGFGFWLVTTLSNYQNTKTKCTRFDVCGRAEIGKGPKSSPCCCSHALRIPSFCFPLAERNMKTTARAYTCVWLSFSKKH